MQTEKSTSKNKKRHIKYNVPLNKKNLTTL